MKTNSILSLALILCVVSAKSQTFFSEPFIISNQIDCPTSIFAADLDNDGDKDVLSTSYWEGKIFWYENSDGNGNFGSSQLITDSAEGANSVFAIDFDNDGDNDALLASWLENKISWYENTDGNGNFSEQKIITTIAIDAHAVYACDIDGDGDNDVLSASHGDNKIAWYENTDGDGNFGEQKIITRSVSQALSVYAIDIDGDGDNDVLSASRNDNKIAWYENTDGTGNFGEQQIISTSLDGAFNVYSCDIDGDGDNDVLSASESDNKIAWYENTDGNGTFDSQKIISTSARGAEMVRACDLDNDGDNDVLAACYFDDKVVWYENIDGNGNFSEEQIISNSTFGIFSIHTTDIDGDGDNDVLSASAVGNKIEWHRNNTTTLVPEVVSNEISIFPNPTNNLINLELENVQNIQQLVVADITGKTIINNLELDQNGIINLSNFESGIYIISMIANNDNYSFRVMKK